MKSLALRPVEKIYIRLFLGFLLLVTILVLVILHFADGFWSILQLLSIWVVIVLGAVFCSGALLLVLNLNKLLLTRPFIRVNKLIHFSLYPHIETMGKLLGIDPRLIRKSLIELNNRLLQTVNYIQPQSKEILLLVPHCLQSSACNVKITVNPQNCKGCGRCAIKDLLRVSNTYGINLAIASGGSAARMHIRSLRPKLVIAVACERDLISGILDMRRLPVYGILNGRPNGPCHDTTVNVGQIEAILDQLLSGPVPVTGDLKLQGQID